MKSLHFLSKLILIVFALIISNESIAQVGNLETNKWNINGNIVDSNQFIGTKNLEPLILKTNDIENFRITPEGNIGIGTEIPETKLDVNGVSTLRGDVILTDIGQLDSSNYDIIFRDETGVLKTGDVKQLSDMIYEAKECQIGPIPNPVWSNGENKIFVNCPQVNVGINTTVPRVNLDVFGTTYSHRLALSSDPLTFNEKLKIGGFSPSNSSNLFVIHNTANELFSFSNQGTMNLNGRFIINSFNSTPLIIQSSTEKILQLESDGLLRTRRIKIDQDSWADYVFENDYELMNLKKLESFIKTNKHLPGVPTTDEVKKEGIDLAELNALLLKKIEELVLYTIQQQKEIDALNKKFESLDN